MLEIKISDQVKLNGREIVEEMSTDKKLGRNKTNKKMNRYFEIDYKLFKMLIILSLELKLFQGIYLKPETPKENRLYESKLRRKYIGPFRTVRTIFCT